MYARLRVVSQKLQYYGLDHLSSTEPMLERMAGDPDPKALRILAAAVQPPVGYEREQLRHYDATSPLNRLIDAVPPESETAREFAEAAKAVVAGNASPEQRREVRRWLVVWRENDAKLEPGLAKSDLTAELAPVSQTLSRWQLSDSKRSTFSRITVRSMWGSPNANLRF